MRAKKRPESFESWCRRNRIAPGDPTPAVSSPRETFRYQGRGAFKTLLKGTDTMPALTTTLEIFCLRTGQSFRARGTAITFERYERPGSMLNHYRELVTCKRCPDVHLLLNAYQAACFDLLGEPLGGDRRPTRRDRSFGRGNNRHLFDRRNFPPGEDAEEAA